MLSNGAVHLGGNVFLGAARDDVDHVYLCDFEGRNGVYTSIQTLSRRVKFQLGIEGRTGGAADGESMSAHVARESCDGAFVMFIAPFETRHILLRVRDGAVCELRSEAPVIVGDWHPAGGATSSVDDSSLLFLLDVEGNVTCIDANTVRHGVAVSPLSVINCHDLIQYHNEHRGGHSASDVVTTTAPKVEQRTVEFVGMHLVPATPGLPLMLLLLGSGGDIFSVKLHQGNLRPTCDATQEAIAAGTMLVAATKPIGGNVAPILQSQPLGVSGKSNTPPLCIHHIVKPELGGGSKGNEALAITCALVDRHPGLHMVTILSSSGSLHIFYLQERDFLSIDLHRTRCDVIITLSSSPLRTAAATVAETTPKQQQSSSKLKDYHAVQVAQRLGSMEPLLRSVGIVMHRNLMGIKLNCGREVYVVALPMWDETRTEWVLLEPFRSGSMRIPSPGNSVADIPAPVAVRVPVSLTGYSIAIGERGELLCFPSEISATAATCSTRPSTVMRLSIAMLLSSALMAGVEAVTMCDGRDPQGELELPSEQEEKECILSSAKLHTELLTRSHSDKLHPLRQHIDEHAVKVASLYAAVKGRADATTARRQKVTLRTLALIERKSQLQRRCNNLESVLCHAILSREGIDSLLKINEKLGDIKKLLAAVSTEVKLEIEEEQENCKVLQQQRPSMLPFPKPAANAHEETERVEPSKLIIRT